MYEEGIQKLVPRYDKCLNNGGEYVENGLKNAESDKNKILHETLLDFLQRNGTYCLNKHRIINVKKSLYIQYQLFLSDLNKVVLFSKYSRKKSSHINLHEHPSRGSRVVPCGQTNMTKRSDALCSSANAPSNATKLYPKTLKETDYFGIRSKEGIIILKQMLNK